MIYILLPVHNRKAVTRHFIDCLCAQSNHNYHLILIDDGSTDGTEEMARSVVEPDRLTVLTGKGNWWWAGSLQQGLDWLKTQRINNDDLILFINDDVCFADDYLENAVRVMIDKKEVLMLSRHLSPTTGDISESGITSDLKCHTFKIADSSDQINCLSTRGLFAHWAVVRSLGGFYPRLLPHYWSDYEYTIRAHQKGFKCETSADIVIIPNHETTGLRDEGADASFNVFIVNYFSKRSVSNPLYASAFILLTSEPQWLPANLLKVWMRAFKTIFKAWRNASKLCPQT